ncbi:MAG: hypothetical protein V4669_04795 [Pseudomonadota bacterium]
MKSLPIIIALLVAPLCSLADVPSCLVGLWKSDEELTLADMRKHPDVSERAKALFENKFFGRLVLVFGTRYIGSYFPGEPQEQTKFEPVRVVDTGPNWVKVKYNLLGNDVFQHWGCDKGKIYSVVSKWEFREYFSPLP